MMVFRDPDEDEWDDEESGYDADSDDADEPTVPCPYCRREILEDSPRCPYCERYISAEDHAGPAKPVWVTVAAVMCLLVALWWAFRPF